MAGAALTALAGCSEDALNGIGVFSSKRAPAQIAVTANRVEIAGPRGFCVETESTQDGATDAFVLMGGCGSITQSPLAQQPAKPALLTASVAAGDAPPLSVEQSLPVLPAFFRSESGRAALSRSGDAASVEVLETLVLDEMFVLRASDTSTNTLDGVAPEYWRGLFDLENALVTISVLSFADAPLTQAEARALLSEFGRRVRRANAPDRPAQPPALGVRLASFLGGAAE